MKHHFVSLNSFHEVSVSFLISYFIEASNSKYRPSDSRVWVKTSLEFALAVANNCEALSRDELLEKVTSVLNTVSKRIVELRSIVK